MPERAPAVIAFALFMTLNAPPDPNELSIGLILDSPLLDETVMRLLFKKARRTGLTGEPNFSPAWVPPFS